MRIGISNLCWFSKGNQDSLDTSVKPVRISRIYASGSRMILLNSSGTGFHKEISIHKKDFCAYTTILDIQLTTGWITFLTNKDGQKVFLERGLVPVSQPVKVIQLD